MPEVFGEWLLPLVYAIGCLVALNGSRHNWRVARLAGTLALLVSLAMALGAITGSWLGASPIDKLGLTASLLVSLLGWVIINYSSRYLAGEPHQDRFIRAMLFTLAAVSLLVLSSNLAVIVVAWSGTSIGLHFLLTHYRERKAAQIVAHKKFLFSRLAEACLVVALVLVYLETGTLTLAGLNAYLGSASALPGTLHWAAALFALAAILKSAQLPLHGWLIQVMEAPTPVSALLHAGVVNMGVFVLVRLAGLLSLAPAAQAMLSVSKSVWPGRPVPRWGLC